MTVTPAPPAPASPFRPPGEGPPAPTASHFVEDPLSGRELAIRWGAVLLTAAVILAFPAPDGITVVEKGRRKGHELSWQSIVSGDAKLMEDLQLSVDAMRE